MPPLQKEDSESRRAYEQPPRRCAYYGESAQGNFAIHRDGFGVGPEVDLCDDCGMHLTPACEEISPIV